MINTILTIIFLSFLGFYIFMITPFGAIWTFKNLDDNKPCYGFLIMMYSVIPVVIIGSYLGYIK